LGDPGIVFEKHRWPEADAGMGARWTGCRRIPDDAGGGVDAGAGVELVIHNWVVEGGDGNRVASWNGARIAGGVAR